MSNDMEVDHARRSRGAGVIAADRVIISTAVTGSVHVPSQSDHLPITPEEIVEGMARLAKVLR